MSRRQTQSGRTILELLAVLLVLLAVGCAVGGNAIQPARQESQAQNDAHLLSKFVVNFNLKMEEGRNKTLIGQLEGETARDLFVELYRLRLIHLDDMHKLAGVSGKPAAPDAYDKANADLLTSENIIFTTAVAGKDLVHLLRGKASVEGVAFMHNRPWLLTHGSQGAAIVFAGETQAQVLTAADIKLKFANNERKVEAPNLNLAEPNDFMGGFPFEHIYYE